MTKITLPKKAALRHRLAQILLILLITFLFLEIATRWVWRNDQTVDLFNRRIVLLPAPLVTEAQAERLAQWSQEPGRYVRFDPVLGWSHTPGVVTELDGATFTTNSIGVRSLREYEPLPPPGVMRLAAFGPSFTHGDEVNDDQTWAAQLEQIRPDVEVMNWGVGGYGTDQAFLTYQTQGAAYHPQVVIIGFEEENVARNVNRFRPFYRPGTGLPLTKPVFVEDADELVLFENPFDDFDNFYRTVLDHPNQFIDQVCPQDFFCDVTRYQAHRFDFLATYRFMRTLVYEIGQGQTLAEKETQPYPTTITFQVVQLFLEEAVRNGATPIVLIFPEISTMFNYDNGKLPSYHLGVVALRDRGVLVIDLVGAFAEAKRTQNLDYQDFFVSESGHFNSLGNEVVAQTILWHICQAEILSDC